MNKLEWEQLLAGTVEELKAKTWEDAQDKMLDAFLEDELNRLELFDDSDNVGFKENMKELFNSFQGHYSYENNSNFTKLAFFE